MPLGMTRKSWTENNPGLSRIHEKISIGNLVFIFVPLEVFLPFCLVIADYYYENFGWQTVILHNGWTPGFHKASNLSPSIHSCFQLELIDLFLSEFEIIACHYVSHTYAWIPIDNHLINKLGAQKVFIYADGFSNRVQSPDKHEKKVSGAFHFGFPSDESQIQIVEILPLQRVVAYYSAIGQFYSIPLNQRRIEPSQDYSVIYLRYWGKLGYCFSDEQVVYLMCKTISSSIPKNSLLLLKNDPRISPEIYSRLPQQLKLIGYETLLIEKFLETNEMPATFGKLPIEYLWTHGWLCSANYHIVFDSTVGFTLSAFPTITRPFQIIQGAAVSEFCEENSVSSIYVKDHVALELAFLDSGYKRNLADAIEKIKYNSKVFAQGIIASLPDILGKTELECIEDQTLFRIIIKKKCY